jgi:ABC-type nickel/cobalt efflux system permease component RcnA
MPIHNLEINILFIMCDPRIDRVETGTVQSRELFIEFSDIPEEEIQSAIDAMVKQGLIMSDTPRSQLSVTPLGINRLKSHTACRVHHFDQCGCGQAHRRSQRSAGSGINIKEKGQS